MVTPHRYPRPAYALTPDCTLPRLGDRASHSGSTATGWCDFCTFGQTIVQNPGLAFWRVPTTTNVKDLQLVSGQTMVQVRQRRRNRKPGRPRLTGKAEGPQSVRPAGAESYPEPCPPVWSKRAAPSQPARNTRMIPPTKSTTSVRLADSFSLSECANGPRSLGATYRTRLVLQPLTSRPSYRRGIPPERRKAWRDEPKQQRVQTRRRANQVAVEVIRDGTYDHAVDRSKIEGLIADEASRSMEIPDQPHIAGLGATSEQADRRFGDPRCATGCTLASTAEVHTISPGSVSHQNRIGEIRPACKSRPPRG